MNPLIEFLKKIEEKMPMPMQNLQKLMPCQKVNTVSICLMRFKKVILTAEMSESGLVFVVENEGKWE